MRNTPVRFLHVISSYLLYSIQISRLEQTAAKIWEYIGILPHSLSNSTCVSAMRRHVLVATPLEH